MPLPLAFGTLFVIVMLRANATYWAGRAAEAGAERTRVGRRLRSERFRRMQALVERWGAPVVTLCFLTVGIQTAVNLAAGVARMPLRRYLPAVTLGAILWAALYASVGVVTWAAWSRLYDRSPAAAIAIVVAVLVGVAAYVGWQLRQRRRDRVTSAAATEPSAADTSG
jgi:membrane protein DedA with SNARE-associated domain